MIGQIAAALGEKHAEPADAIDERHEHGGRHGCAGAPRQTKSIGQVQCFFWRGTVEALAQPGLLGGRSEFEQGYRHRRRGASARAAWPLDVSSL
jgi:hypothetical protein